MAFRAFFSILGGRLPDDIARAFGYSRSTGKPASDKAAAVKERSCSDGALQLLGILQRDARLLDFFLEDISPYSDEQVGSAVRNVHAQSRESLRKYFQFAPVIDGVEGTYTKAESAGGLGKDPGALKFVGNLPPQGKPTGGILRHKGWRVDSHEFPVPSPRQNLAILAPAELEVE
jgi:hypothetical protein